MIEHDDEVEEEKPEYFSPLAFCTFYGVNDEQIDYLVKEFGLPVDQLESGESVVYVKKWQDWKKANPEFYQRFKGPNTIYSGGWLVDILFDEKLLDQKK